MLANWPHCLMCIVRPLRRALKMTGIAHGVNVQSKGRQPQMWLSFPSLVRS